jgi:hypothetical protein
VHSGYVPSVAIRSRTGVAEVIPDPLELPQAQLRLKDSFILVGGRAKRGLVPPDADTSHKCVACKKRLCLSLSSVAGVRGRDVLFLCAQCHENTQIQEIIGSLPRARLGDEATIRREQMSMLSWLNRQ